jgi:hemerythrin-like domain-containing protein
MVCAISRPWVGTRLDAEWDMNTALAELLAQHDQLRTMIDRCQQLADELDAGHGSADALGREIVRLRVAFDHHNKLEEHVLRPLLRDSGAFADVRIDRMVSEHIEEHRAMRERFTSSPTAELREALTMLREHLATEERYFLSTRVVRDDLVVIEGGS